MWWCAGVQKMDQFEQSVTISYPSQTGKFLQMTCTRVAPNKSFKPKPLRYANHMADKACHVLRSTARLGLTLVLGAMDFDSIRPVISGLIGASVAVWLTSRWQKSLPKHLAGKSNEDLARRHKLAVLVANALFFIGLGIGLAMYKLGG